MPINTITITGTTGTDVLSNLYDATLNTAKSMASAIGASCEELINPPSDGKYYYVLMDSIGYEGWCVVFRGYDESSSSYPYSISVSIYKTDASTKVPDLNDDPISSVYRTEGSTNVFDGCPETCVMICDENKDTVLIDIHEGKTMNGTDLGNTTSISDGPFRYTMFFARDTNNAVVCGIGVSSINAIRTSETRGDYSSVTALSQKNSGLGKVIHLTKMINYLDPNYPEMKSAYISVIRPFDSNASSKKRVPLYSINGENWGGVGDTDWSHDYRKDGSLYFPINPFVKY